MPSPKPPATPAYRFNAIGTPWRIDTPEPLTPELQRGIADRIDQFDATYSRFREDSLVSRIGRAPGSWRFPNDAAPLFDLYKKLYTSTAGMVSPLVGERMENLGYDRAYSLRAASVPVRVPAWDDAFSWDGESLTTARPVLLDVGAAGKGYLVDIVAGMLRDAGIDSYLVDASGDLLHRGSEPVRIALEHPGDAGKAIGIYSLHNGALCASASNRRAWGAGLHHIIDAITGEPTSQVVASWAMTDTALEADGLATALFFAGAGTFAPDFTFHYVRMFSNGSLEYSRELPGEIFQ